MNTNSNTISIQHISISIHQPFEEVCSEFESRLGTLDYAAFERVLGEGNPQAARRYLKEKEGPLGLMIFNVIDHGSLLRLEGKTGQARQYVVGNPLFALQMTSVDIRAGLYAPLRVYVREDGPDRSVIEYDLPSSLFDQFRSTAIDGIAKMLDEKLKAATN